MLRFLLKLTLKLTPLYLLTSWLLLCTTQAIAEDIFAVEADSIAAVENGLSSKLSKKEKDHMNIIDRMGHYHAPGVSIAVIKEGKLAWAKGYGALSVSTNSKPVDTDTLFQAGSISKSLTAIGALILVQQGKLFLDQDVNLHLQSWKVPENKFTKSEKVTLRRLLSHSAGTSVHGFPGYSRSQKIPSLPDILNGRKPIVNTDPIRVTSKPGSKYRYSGGGTTIIQQLIEDVTGEKFDIWMQNNVLLTLGMHRSTFTQPLAEESSANRASGYIKSEGVKGGWHIYPEMAAAGLWTTPSDLARFILSMQSILEGKPGILNESLAREMITIQKDAAGLGVFIHGQGKNVELSHEGEDEGFIAVFCAYPFTGQGMVIMVNQEDAGELRDEIKRSIVDTYHFPNPLE